MKKQINSTALRHVTIAIVVMIALFIPACDEDNSGSDGVWTLLSDNPFGTDTIKSVAWGGGKFVAVGMKGKIAHSSDGKKWTLVSSSPFGNSAIHCVSFGNGKFMAGGESGKLAFSDDGGENWTSVALSGFNNNEINGIVWGTDKWVAVGRSRIAYSNDSEGTTWSGADSNGPFDYGQGSPPLMAVAFGNGKFVMAGPAGGQGHGASLAYSSTGVNNDWTKVTGVTEGGLVSVFFGNGKFITFNQTEVFYSADGANWTRAEASLLVLNKQLNSAAAGNGKFIAVGYNDAFFNSADGITWTLQKGISFNKHFNDIAFGNGAWVAVGINGAVAYKIEK